ncbi:MAG: hypothetical protein GYA55_07800 [SAR324 cluster bacterium]|uniref:Uncharacterized protein n=1 Tax=SAR324 cluster bacterium TaxID=2024889 RepID=A0A7X9IKD1_9DELT|nr:hypothetical protein [SAR324 cluster bacterium]
MHHFWLRLSDSKQLGSRLHHRDIVGFVLKLLKKDLESLKRVEVVEELESDFDK